MPDLVHIREKVDTLREEVHSLIESHMAFNPPVIPLMVQKSPPNRPINFYLFVEGDVEVPIGTTNRGHLRDLQDSNNPYDQALKKAQKDLVEIKACRDSCWCIFY